MEERELILGAFVLNLLQFFSLYIVLDIFEKKMRGNFVKKTLVGVTSSLTTVTLIILNHDNLVIFVYVLFFILNYFVFNIKIKRLIIEFILIYSYSLLIELIVTYILLSFNFIDKYNIYNGIKVTFSILLLNLFIYKRIEYEKFISIYKKHKKFIIVMFEVLFIPTLIIFIKWKATVRQGQSIVMYKEVFLFLVFWFFIIVYYVFNNIRIREKERMIKVQKEYTAILKGLVEEARLIQHENKNHITTVMCILENDDIENKVENAIKYMSGLVGSKNDFKQSLNIKNHIVRAIVYGKLKEIEREEIELNLKIDNSLDFSMIEDYLLAEIFGNLIKNAIEACKEYKRIDKFISIVTRKEDDFLIIEVSNSVDSEKTPSLEDMIMRGYSTKIGKDRGYGMTNINEAIKKYKGTLSLNIKKEYLSITVRIPTI